MRIWLLIVGLLLFAGIARGQDGVEEVPGDIRERLTPEAGPSFPLRPFVIRRSLRVEVNGLPLDAALYSFQADDNVLRIEPAVLDTTRDLIVRYSTIPLRPDPLFTYVDTSAAIVDPLDGRADTGPDSRAQGDDPFAGVALQRRGSVTRGITTGSNRDVGVESGLRLELSGEIAEGVAVRAMLSDENTPILPEGTTRRVEEFDRVYIEVESPVGRARLGDVDYRLDQTQFARLTRKLQGAAIDSRITTPRRDLMGFSVNAAGAISRGQFRSQTIPILDGVQGPYRLRGAQGEQFVLVIPGTERIFWDGELLERGENRDYVIDYATGELSFTTNRIVTAERRVLAEFEYSTNQFTRTLLAAQAQTELWRSGDRSRIRLGGAVIREADGSRFLDEFGLTSEDSLRLAQAGDAAAYRSGAEQVVFDPEAPFVQYVQRDTALATGVMSYFEPVGRRPTEGESVYRVRFANVGTGSGSYERAGQAVNGVAYTFRGPGQGSYEPVRILPAPVEKQLVDLYGTMEILPRVEIFGEWAASLHDQNRLSPLDSQDDRGGAYELGIRLQPTGAWHGISLSGHARRRLVDDTFSPFDRIRPVEFGRHWNLSQGPTEAGFTLQGREESDEAMLQIRHDEVGELRGEIGALRLGTWFQGARQSLLATTDEGAHPLHLQYRGERIASTDQLVQERGSWIRHRAAVQYPLVARQLTSSIQLEHEDRRQQDLVSDSLTTSSFRFSSITPGLRWSAGGVTASADLTYRTDDQWIDGRLEQAYDSWIATSGAEIARSSFNGHLRLGYRQRTYSDLFRVYRGQADHSSLLIRGGTQWRPHPRAIEVLTTYEATSERTPLLQEIFVRTGPEFGQFVWEDLNDDGIVQVDELIPERTPNEGVYAKTFLPTDSLISSVTVQARAEVRLDGSSVWQGEDGVRGVLGRMSSRSVFEVHETTRDDDIARIYLLYLTRFREPATTINGRVRIGQNITLWPRSRRVTFDLGHNQVRSLSTRTSGAESRFFSTWTGEGRWIIVEPLTVRLLASRERNQQSSQQFATRRFDITGYRLEPEAILRVTDRLRASTPVALAWKEDLAAARSARVVRVPLEIQYQLPARFSWTSRLEAAHVDVTGMSRGLAEYELTDGRGPGTSFLWSTSARYSINEYLRATLQYDGRAPEGAPVVHALRMQLSAVF